MGNEVFPVTWCDKVILHFIGIDRKVLGVSQLGYYAHPEINIEHQRERASHSVSSDLFGDPVEEQPQILPSRVNCSI